MAATDGIVDPWYFNGFPEPVQAEAKYSKTLADKRTEMFVRLYMCKPEEFDSLYDSLVQEYMQIGGTEVMNERKEIYNRVMK
jgi:putative aldouronate transport system substrate-binding protein